jgi:hypothetical protein
MAKRTGKARTEQFNGDRLEISVRSLLTGQQYVADSLWEILAFELIARHGFDMLLELMGVLERFGEDIRYLGTTHGNEEAGIEDSHVAQDLEAMETPRWAGGSLKSDQA